MKKIISCALLTLCLLLPTTIMADECMEGDCDNGTGTGFTEDGRIYSGEWKDGLPHGKGKLTVSKGKYVKGRWEHGKLVDKQ